MRSHTFDFHAFHPTPRRDGERLGRRRRRAHAVAIVVVVAATVVLLFLLASDAGARGAILRWGTMHGGERTSGLVDRSN